jgi:hypothetical protein
MSSGVLQNVAQVSTDVSEEHIASETSLITGAMRCNIPEDNTAIRISHKTAFFGLTQYTSMGRLIN